MCLLLKKIVNNQGYSVHLKYVHPESNKPPVATVDECLLISEVKIVVETIVNDVCASIDPPVADTVESTSSSSAPKTVVDLMYEIPKSNRWGREKRRNYIALFKAEVIEYIDANSPDITQEKATLKCSVSQSNVSKWWKKRVSVMNEAGDNKRNNLTKMRRGTKYDELFKELLEEGKQARLRGYLVNFNWVWNKARNIYRKQIDDVDALVRKHVITTFLRKFNVRMRARQRNSKYSKEHYRGDLMKWHGMTRERLIRTGFNEDYDTKWRRFLPNTRFNVDQSPLPFVIDHKRTYEIIGKDQHHQKVWIQQPGRGLDKR
jgi:hypothetical protein